MARKRGGLAGIYDRNKKYIKTLAPIAAGFIPGVGPAIGAALGAAMGADTEGKGYFKGFDAGGAAMGGLSGYGGAKLGQSARGGLAKMFTGKGASSIANIPSATSVMPQGLSSNVLSGAGGAGSAGGAGAVGAAVSNVAASAPPAVLYEKPLSRLGKASKFFKENKDLIAMARPDAASDAKYMDAETNRMRLEDEREQMKMEQERRRRMAELLMPMFTQMQSRPSYGG